VVISPAYLVLADLGDHEVGSGSGLLNAVQQFSGALGVAVLGTLLFNLLPEHGFPVSTRWVTGVTLGCYAAGFLTVFLLPLKPRAEPAVH